MQNPRCQFWPGLRALSYGDIKSQRKDAAESLADGVASQTCCCPVPLTTIELG